MCGSLLIGLRFLMPNSPPPPQANRREFLTQAELNKWKEFTQEARDERRQAITRAREVNRLLGSYNVVATNPLTTQPPPVRSATLHCCLRLCSLARKCE